MLFVVSTVKPAGWALYFSQEAFDFVVQGLLSIYWDDTVTAIFLDEAGPLELSGLGFARILPILLHSGKEIYLTVRRACLEQFLIEFDIGGMIKSNGG